MDDMERAKTRKRKFVKSPLQFKLWYTALIEWTKTLRESSKIHGWTVIDQELFDEHWRPPKNVVMKETLASLRAENTELTKKVTRLEKAIAKLEEYQIAKKRKLNKDGGPSGAVDTSAELARQVQQWREPFSAENKELKEQNETLKVQYASEVKKHAATTASLGDEKAAKKDLQVALRQQKELDEMRVKHLEERIQELKDDLKHLRMFHS